MTPVEPEPAASVLLVRSAPDGVAGPIEVYMIRRQRGMRFLGGYYAFPGGKVDAADATETAFARCRGISPAEAARLIPPLDGLDPLAFWVSAARELLEETGLLVACEADGRPVETQDRSVVERVERLREALSAGEAPLATLLERERWYLDLGAFRYLSHFITSPSSPIRFTARFFLAPVPAGQEVRLFGGEASEGFWIEPAEGYSRFRGGEMPMAEPAYSGLAYLTEFESLHALWVAHADGRHKIHGINDRIRPA